LSSRRLICDSTSFFLLLSLGIDTKSLSVKRKDPDVAQWVKVLKEKYAGKKLIVARDKMDYIKGVRQKMLAFERFLNLYPEWQGKVNKSKMMLLRTEIYSRDFLVTC